MKRNPPQSIVHFLIRTFAVISLLAAMVNAVPDPVLDAFRDRYGEPKDVDWAVDSNGFWEAGFEKDGDKHRADFTESGRWVETERSVRFEDLPDALKTAIRREHGDREIAEIEEVHSQVKGHFYDVEFDRQGPNEDIEYGVDGTRRGSFLPPITTNLPDIEEGRTKLHDLTLGGLMFEFGINLLSVLIYAYAIYYRRHHNHKMMFLLLAFNLFLFPIFLLSSVLTLGFGFTIFALLALVRLRSENFDKAEVAYLLGAVALTFINSQLSASIELAATAVVLLTAFFADHPSFRRSAYQTTWIRYRLDDPSMALDRSYLRHALSDEYDIIVNDVEIERVERKQVRLKVVYSDQESGPRRKRLDAAKAKEEKARKKGGGK